jgi:peroxiredoxin
MRRLASFTSLLAIGILAVPAVGDDPDPKEIIAKVDQTIRTIKTVSYKVRIWGEGDIQDRMSRVRANVKAKDAGPERPPYFRIEGDARLPGSEEAQPFRVILGEKQAMSINEKEKLCTVGDLPVGFDLIADLIIEPTRSVIMHEFLHRAPFEDELKADSYRYEGQKTISGTACHVIHVTYAAAVAQARWYFGIDDFLPHRVDRFVNAEGVTGARVSELIQLDTTPNFDEKTFAIDVPEGYQQKTYERPLRSDPRLLQVGDQAPEWTLKTPKGKSVSLADLRGKVVVLFFWTSWLEPCKQLMPRVQKLHEKFQEKPVAVFGVNVGEKAADVDPAEVMKQGGCTFAALLGGGKMSADYRVALLPALYVIGPEGKVMYAVLGYDPFSEPALHRLIESAAKP